MLAHGFARVRCESCKDELLVAFSCKGRRVCPSCNAKRAHVTAVHLVEQVLPLVPYQQWENGPPSLTP
ncbi:MAG TPA: transposase zinc-binding domain-containing protein [Myxococcaceae bacterium]